MGLPDPAPGLVFDTPLDAPARVEVVTEQEIDVRPTVTAADHLRAVPGVDVATSGIQSTNVVARGFNNVFSGALYMLSDHRIAGVPSLRVNLMHFVPSTNEDLESIEVVLGPGAALYGPNTANGVLHMLTRSPLTSTVSAGFADALTAEQAAGGAAAPVDAVLSRGPGAEVAVERQGAKDHGRCRLQLPGNGLDAPPGDIAIVVLHFVQRRENVSTAGFELGHKLSKLARAGLRHDTPILILFGQPPL